MSGQLHTMAVSPGSLRAYAPVAGDDPIERVRAAARPLQGARIVHLSAAGAGGRVPEYLGALLPLAADAGLDVDWRVLFGEAEIHEIARALVDGLQGAETAIGDSAWRAYLDACSRAVERLGDGYDLLVLHDPGTLGAAPAASRALWHCHVDASKPDGPTLERAAPLLRECVAAAFPADSFAPPEPRGVSRHALAPGIDPFGPRNLELPPAPRGRLVRPLGVDLARPFCCQVMRFDRWKDPHASIEAFSLVKEELPELQLVLAGRLESDDPAGWRVVKEITDYAAGQADVHLLTSYEGVGDLELGALQRLARVHLQRSLRGFGLSASEALWKGTPVIGGTGGGLPLQVRDGIDGYLTDDTAETARRLVELVLDPGLAVEMGRAGMERVRERFLLTRALEDELRSLAAVLSDGGEPVTGTASMAS